ncbi:MAG: hypothetical protein K6T56_06490 [Burkholderiales bacterium]|nr:hypothetical protein [Burkholderiales bacterium]
MEQAVETIHIEITAEVNERRTPRLRLALGGKEETALYLDSPPARALAAYLIRRADRVDVPSSLQQTRAAGA